MLFNFPTMPTCSGAISCSNLSCSTTCDQRGSAGATTSELSRCLPKRSKANSDHTWDEPTRQGGILAFGPTVQGLHQLRVTENALRYVLSFLRRTRCPPVLILATDGRRPICRACEGRKQRCRGYRRDEFIFMSDGWRAPGVASQPANASSRQSPRNEISPVHEDCRDDDASSHALSFAPSRPLTPEPMAIYASFFLSQFTPNPPQAVLVMIQNCRRYLGQLLDRPSPGSPESNTARPHPTTDAAEALVTTYFGRQHGSDLLIRESIRSYGRALKSFSLKLDQVQSIGLVSVEEDEWIHLAFSCVFLTLWEVSGKPATRRS